MREANYNIGLLPWYVLGGGVLSGKYKLDDKGDVITKAIENARLVKIGELQS